MTIDNLDALGALLRRLRHTEAVARLCSAGTIADDDARLALDAIEDALSRQVEMLDAIIDANTPKVAA